MTPEDLRDDLMARGVKYVFGFYVDILGVPKSKCVPVEFLPSMAAGSELYTVGALEGMGDLGPHEDECAGIPELDRVVVPPWQPGFAMIPTRLHLNGELYPMEGRNFLAAQVEEARQMGFVANVGIEPEFYVIKQEEGRWKPLVSEDQLNTPTRGYDLEATLLAEPFLGPMAQYMKEMDWGLYSFDHEGGDGQYEFNFHYTDAMTMADRMVLFRLMAKHCAREVGCIATFMPKPFQDDFGSASHINISLADSETADNLFASPDGTYSELSRHFVAGVLEHAGAIMAVTSPLVNSYKRFTSKGHMDEISWAPIYRAWGENNRTLMCRMPVNRHCLEVRTADASVNYHLGIGVVLAAGLDGIRRKLDPGAPLNFDMYRATTDQIAAAGDISLPVTLADALNELEADDLVRDAMGAKFHSTYLDYKRREVADFNSVVTNWEIDRYLQQN